MRISLAVSGGDDDAAYVVLEGTADQQILHLTPAIGQPTLGSRRPDRRPDLRGPRRRAAHAGSMTSRARAPAPATVVQILDLTDLGVIDTLGTPPAIAQGAGSFDASPWPTSAVSRGSRLVLAQAETCVPPGSAQERSCLRIVDLNVANEPPTARQDVYLAASGTDTYGGGLAFSQSGELIVTYARSSSADGLSSYVVRQAPDDPLGSFSAPRTLQGAAALYAEPNGAAVGRRRAGSARPRCRVGDQPGRQDGRPARPTTSGPPRSGRRRAPRSSRSPRSASSTRATGVGLSGSFVSGTPRSFEVAGVGAIPDDAIAVTGNVTVTGQTSPGLRLDHAVEDASNPTSSTINFPLGDTRANNLTVSAGHAQAISPRCSRGRPARRAHVLLDITGYFVAGDSEHTYEPLTPARILDTRSGNGLSGRFQANTPRTFDVAGRGGVPQDAVAITGNLTVVGQIRRRLRVGDPDPRRDAVDVDDQLPVR